jgi:hypothetical protein
MCGIAPIAKKAGVPGQWFVRVAIERTIAQKLLIAVGLCVLAIILLKLLELF